MSFNIKSKIIASLENSELQQVVIPEAKFNSEELQNEYNKDVAVGEELSEEIQSLEDANEQLINLDDNIAQQAVNIQAMEGGSEEGSAEPATEGEAPAQAPEEGQAEGEGEVASEPEPTLDESSSDEEVGQETMEEQAALESFSRDLSGHGRKQLLGSFGMESIGYRNILANPREAYKETHRQFLKVRSAAMEAIRTSEGNIISKMLDWVSGDDALWAKYSPGATQIRDDIKAKKSEKLQDAEEVSMRVTILASELPKVCAKNFNSFYDMKLSKGHLDKFPKLPSNVKVSGSTDLKNYYPLGIEDLTSVTCKVLVIDDRINSEGKNDITTIVLELGKPDEVKNGDDIFKLADAMYKNMIASRDLVDPTVSGALNGMKRYLSMGPLEMFAKSFLGGVGLSHEIVQRIDNLLTNNLISKAVSYIVSETVGKTIAGTLGLVGGGLAILNTPAILGVSLITYFTRGRWFSRASKDNMLYYYYYHAMKEIGKYLDVDSNDWKIKF